MATLDAYGIEARLPSGFEGRIYRRVPVGGAQTYPVAQFTTFALPADTADFGGAYVDQMRPTDIFAVLFEFGPDSLGKALFARVGLPTRLTPADFSPYTLRRGTKGQGGAQVFFTQSRRPFTLYVVLGSYSQRLVLVPRVNDLLAGLTVRAPSPAGVP
ncbi:MAG TPA: hypothetical protein VKV25_08025 [Acidimicrobiales bacterium]|nr:hypothetical protein [Acidimicrobiales bacterium]